MLSDRDKNSRPDKLAGWKMNLLSRPCQVSLGKSVVTSISIHSM